MKISRAKNLYELLTDREIEAEYKIPRATQKKWRRMRYHDIPGFNGFPFLKIGRIVRYRRAEIEAWLAELGRAGSASIAKMSPENVKPGQLNLFKGD